MPVAGLERLPVELLYEIQLYALSQFLPYTSRQIHQLYKSAPPSFHAQYILRRLGGGRADASEIFTRVLRYPICSIDVLNAICRHLPDSPPCPFSRSCEPPRRLFRPLTPKPGVLKWKEREHPLPFLRCLLDSPKIPRLNYNSHDGYALTKAVHARFLPLICFLLDHGASPKCKQGLAVMVAIRQKDLSLVKLLVERDPPAEFLEGGSRQMMGGVKRRRLEDRLEVTLGMLKAAVKSDAKDIVEYFTREKGCIPDMQTLQMICVSFHD